MNDMECFNKSLDHSCNLVDYDGLDYNYDNDEDGYDPSYDEDLVVDSQGICMCNSDKEYLQCLSFEKDE